MNQYVDNTIYHKRKRSIIGQSGGAYCVNFFITNSNSYKLHAPII